MEVLRILSALSPGVPRTYRNLTMFPLLGSTPTSEPGYLTLDEALATQQARVTEVSESGSVPVLLFVSAAQKPILILDGEELVGAKQNRTVNVTILAPPSATLSLPVTCVEAGRWRHTSSEFQAAPHSHYNRGRVQKLAKVNENLRAGRGHQADQSEVWREIDDKARRMATASPTHAMSDIYAQHASSVESFVSELNQPVSEMVGALFLLNGEVVGFDAFDHPATLCKLLPKLIRSQALDALDTPAVSTPEETLLQTRAAAFLQLLGQATVEPSPAVGLGEEYRLSGPRLTGAALCVDGVPVHLCAFHVSEPVPATTPTATLRRASTRARRHTGASGE